jgi:hypothetical protein
MRNTVMAYGYQKRAFEVALALPYDAHVFAFEKGKGGSRSYLVSSYAGFWEFYSRLGPKDRHHYELIRENSACRLYFDLEYPTACNPIRVGARMRETLMVHVREQLEEDGVIPVGLGPLKGLRLESSNAAKYSEHVVVHLPAYTVFDNNVSMGLFVARLLARLQQRRQGDTAVAELFVADGRGSERCFVDDGVYTKNRCPLHLRCTSLQPLAPPLCAPPVPERRGSTST